MVLVAQLVRALDCGSRSRQFESDLAPMKKKKEKKTSKSDLAPMKKKKEKKTSKPNIKKGWHKITKEEQEKERISVYDYII